jgi:ATP-dependent RNA helicase DHX29
VDEDRIDFDLLEDLLGAIHEGQGEGAVLVFLPGMAEINQLHGRLAAARRFAAGASWLIPLHSTVSPADQRRVRPPPSLPPVCAASCRRAAPAARAAHATFFF